MVAMLHLLANHRVVLFSTYIYMSALVDCLSHLEINKKNKNKI